jgi:hypothetical protein
MQIFICPSNLHYTYDPLFIHNVLSNNIKHKNGLKKRQFCKVITRYLHDKLVLNLNFDDPYIHANDFSFSFDTQGNTNIDI